MNKMMLIFYSRQKMNSMIVKPIKMISIRMTPAKIFYMTIQHAIPIEMKASLYNWIGLFQGIWKIQIKYPIITMAHKKAKTCERANDVVHTTLERSMFKAAIESTIENTNFTSTQINTKSCSIINFFRSFYFSSEKQAKAK